MSGLRCLTVAGGAGAVGTAVPPLPEVRALLAEVATRLDAAAATDPVLAAVRDGLAALALLSTGGASGTASSPATALGIDPVTLRGCLPIRPGWPPPCWRTPLGPLPSRRPCGP